MSRLGHEADMGEVRRVWVHVASKTERQVNVLNHLFIKKTLLASATIQQHVRCGIAVGLWIIKGLSHSTEITNNLQKLLICHDVMKSCNRAVFYHKHFGAQLRLSAEGASLRCFHKHSSLSLLSPMSPSFYYTALSGAAGDVYLSGPWCLASKQTLARVLVWSGPAPCFCSLLLLHIRITTEPQLANESQALTAHRTPAH